MMSKTQIKRLRLALGLSQAQLAAEVGVHFTLVSSWEAGRRKPSGPALLLLKQMAEKVKGAAA